jgi:hypothetical protein
MHIKLKSKIDITKDFLNDLIAKSWTEIEQLQNQLNNIEANEEAYNVRRLLENLLTSYYVFVGGLENLTDKKTPETLSTAPETLDISEPNELLPEENIPVVDLTGLAIEPDKSEDFEPFEYFVDFEDPSGDPITDEELYG